MMTAEEKREQLLKRALPALAVTVIYFVFISGLLTEKMKKAETDYKTLFSSGVSPEALPGVVNAQSQTQQKLTLVQKQVTVLQGQLTQLAGFLSNSDTSTNAAMRSVNAILAHYQVKIRKDEKSQWPEAKLGLALKEVWQGIKPPVTPDPKNADKKPADAVISVHHLWLKGGYISMYQALTAIAAPSLQVLPISLTMHMPDSDENNAGELEWELILWM